MSKKHPNSLQDESSETDLERHVDQMMDKSMPDPGSMVAPTAPEVDTNYAESITAADTGPAPETGNVAPAASNTMSDYSDPETDALVDDIVVHESDELLAAHDEKLKRQFEEPAAHRSFGSRIKGFFGAWWRNKLARYGTLLILLAAICGLAAMPTSRYYAMNVAGIRSAASLTILDSTTQLPLKNVTIELGDHTAKTNKDGLVKLHGLKLGMQPLAIRQAGFAAINRTVTLGLGSNPLGDFTLEAVGMQFRFRLTDYLTGKVVKSAEINSGDSSAKANDRGEIVLTVDKDAYGSQKATISAEGYRNEDIDLGSADKPGQLNQAIAMVPSQKEIYISKQSGKYDLYKIDIDGKNKQLLLAGTGQEDTNITVVPHSSGNEVAVVSRRDSTRNQDGFQLQTLTLLDVKKGTTLTLDHSERIQIVDWTGDSLVYVKVKAGTSAGNPERYQLISYDYNTTARLQLATANIFNDILVAKGNVYFAASNNFQGGTSQLVRIAPDNTGKQVLIDKTDVWNILRTSYNNLSMSTLQGNYTYKLGDSTAKKVSNTPGLITETKFYLDAPDGKRALWTDSRDGKGVLLVYTAATGKDTPLAAQSGLTYPVRWLNSRTIIYRVATPAETADYVVSLDGGTPKKIVDLTSTAGLGMWNYR